MQDHVCGEGRICRSCLAPYTLDISQISSCTNTIVQTSIMLWLSNFTHDAQPFPPRLLHWYPTCLHVSSVHSSLEGCAKFEYNRLQIGQNDTYDHRTLKIRLPVRSAIYKQCTGGLVVRWVTTSEFPLLYVFAFLK